MSSDAKTIKISVWITVFYGMFSLSLAVWIIYLYFNLPIMHESTNWRIMWVVFDLLMLSQGVLAFYFLYKKSPWAVMPLVALVALFASDIWFDMMTAITSDEKTSAMMSATLAELPLIILSLTCAVYIFKQIIKKV